MSSSPNYNPTSDGLSWLAEAEPTCNLIRAEAGIHAGALGGYRWRQRNSNNGEGFARHEDF
jgi:hypothetical protein